MEDEIIIKITDPKIDTIYTHTADNPIAQIIRYDYSESHVIYKGIDLGSFHELLHNKILNLKQIIIEREEDILKDGFIDSIEEQKKQLKLAKTIYNSENH